MSTTGKTASVHSETMRAQPSQYFLHARSPMLTVSIVALMILGFGGFLMSFFIEADYARDEKNWQEKLSIIAETRASNISQWVTTEQSNIRNIADNPSLQLYVSEWMAERELAKKSEVLPPTDPAIKPIETMNPAPIQDAPQDSAQATFIRNLLVYSAERLNYTTAGALTNVNARENVAPETGLMLIGQDNVPLIAIPSDTLNARIMEYLSRTGSAAGGMSELYINDSGKILLGFSQPISAIQDSGSNTPIARLVGIKEVTAPLQQYLSTREGIDPKIEIALVKTDSGNLQYLTANSGNENKIESQMVANDPATALEAASISQTQANIRGENRNGVPSLITSHAIKNAPWSIVVSVAEDHALTASNMRRQTMWGAMMAFSVIMALLIVTIWFVATSQRALSHSRHFRNLAKHSSMQESLLKLVANAQPESLFLIDSDFRFRYANYPVAKATSTSVENLVGKSLSDVLGQAKAQTLTTLATEAMNTGRTQTLMLSIQKDGRESTILRTLVPVSSLGAAAETPRNDPHVLIIDRDITEVTEARERRMKLNNELIELLVALMDQRDQHANNHSRYVAELAQAIAKNMGLKDITQQHVYHAGLLMNVGKMIVPEKWLNSSEPLEDKNIKSIRQSLKASSQLLNKLDFDPAVISALRQAHEYVDGSGLEGLKGQDISIEARIITVANDCISMMSRRAYRNPMSWDAVAKNLTNDIDTKYDRGVVAALISYMENMGGKEQLKVINSKKAA